MSDSMISALCIKKIWKESVMAYFEVRLSRLVDSGKVR
jgi:hypothetical protein